MTALRRMLHAAALGLALCLALLHGPAHAVVAGGMAIVYRTFPVVSGGYHDMEFTITVTKEPGYNGRTYWAHQWSFTGTQDSGYVGLQSVSGYDKILNFSIWNATGWRDSTGANCGYFSHEGNGVQCWINYAWKEGVTYKVRVAKDGADGWRATIIDTQTNAQVAVATIVVPTSYGGLSQLVEWVENFSQGQNELPSCAAVPTAIAVYGVPTANGGTVRPSSTRTNTYGNCMSVAKSFCSTEAICTLSANPSAPFQEKQLRNTFSGYCLDLLSGGAAAGLYHCSPNANQIFSHDVQYRLHRVSQPAQCLGVDGNDRVVAQACSDSARQQWLKVPRTSTYFNAGTAKCLDPLEHAALEAPLRAFTCLGTGLQQWTAP
ncbi:hypothetical protein PCA20602_03318 [Pandoraea capi]|uniref:Ricin B lectin domain-containing protein n=1 Tax=Pandoraea capi TaxID=2508286 RepID=A0ABY6W6F8_9BURK|nr:ricin-type beta-trefoil lectin domain protein [Pandoraea capi]VVE24435.1 hypothetical protein PCA20602_03318 [Pandoraea capi]